MSDSKKWRLVCHRCGHKYPLVTLVKADCCPDPELHIHNTDRPCEECSETVAESAS